MLKRMILGLVPTTVTHGIIAWCILLLLVLTLSLVACGGSSEPAVTPEPTTKEAPPASAAFQTTGLAINPAEVNPRVEVIITAEVTNIGGTEGSYTPRLRIDDITKASLPTFYPSKEVTIAAGASQLLSFIVSKDTPGTYKVTWDELTGEFAVVKPDEPTEPSSPKTSTPKSTTAPDFTGVDVVTNETISLSQFKGTIVLLNFVNYGCSSSLNQIVSAQLLAIKDLREQRDDFVPLSVFCGCCPPDVLREFALQNDLTWPWILDTDNSIVRQYTSYLRKYGYPTLIFIDEEQQITEVTGYCDISTLSVKIDET